MMYKREEEREAEWNVFRTNDTKLMRDVALIFDCRGIRHFIRDDGYYPPTLSALCDRAFFYATLARFGVRTR